MQEKNEYIVVELFKTLCVMNVYIFLGKYSDWLEAYSIFEYFENIEKVSIYFIESERTNFHSVKSLYLDFKKKYEFSYHVEKNQDEHFLDFSNVVKELSKNDVIAAPFVRLRGKYCPFLSKIKSRGAYSVHLSECLPDSFGIIGYRFGFRMRNHSFYIDLFKQLFLIPMQYLYAITHKPDFCFYELEPYVHNDFVKKTIRPSVPVVSEDKAVFLKKFVMDEKRTLLVAGFGYKVDKMAHELGLNKYIATSKNKEIVIDGKVIPLDFFICAEEVLLCGIIDRIVGYNSTVMCWAHYIGGIKIECYNAKQQSDKAGFYFEKLSRKTLKKCGIDMMPQNDNMVSYDESTLKDFTKIL